MLDYEEQKSLFSIVFETFREVAIKDGLKIYDLSRETGLSPFFLYEVFISYHQNIYDVMYKEVKDEL